MLRLSKTLILHDKIFWSASYQILLDKNSGMSGYNGILKLQLNVAAVREDKISQSDFRSAFVGIAFTLTSLKCDLITILSLYLR